MDVMKIRNINITVAHQNGTLANMTQLNDYSSMNFWNKMAEQDSCNPFSQKDFNELG